MKSINTESIRDWGAFLKELFSDVFDERTRWWIIWFGGGILLGVLAILDDQVSAGVSAILTTILVLSIVINYRLEIVSLEKKRDMDIDIEVSRRLSEALRDIVNNTKDGD